MAAAIIADFFGIFTVFNSKRFLPHDRTGRVRGVKIIIILSAVHELDGR